MPLSWHCHNSQSHIFLHHYPNFTYSPTFISQTGGNLFSFSFTIIILPSLGYGVSVKLQTYTLYSELKVPTKLYKFCLAHQKELFSTDRIELLKTDLQFLEQLNVDFREPQDKLSRHGCRMLICKVVQGWNLCLLTFCPL